MADYNSAYTGAQIDANLALAATAQQPPIEGPFVNGDKTKLNGIEALADVTDTANVTAAGALMDSEVTNLAAVKAFDPAAYATAAQGTLASTAVQPGSLATVATTGAYADLSGKPTLGTAAAAATTDFATAAQGSLADSAVQPIDLATVATTGLYSDLSGKPTLGTAAAAATTDFATAAQGALADSAVQPLDLATVATSGLYSDLSGKPTLGTAAAAATTDFATAAQGTLADSAVQPGDLATVATTGAYADLTGKPTLATVATSGSYTDLTNKPTIPSALAVSDEGVSLTTAATSLNFVGAGVTATNTGGAVTVTVPGGGASGSWERISTTTVAAPTGTIDYSGAPATYSKLRLVANGVGYSGTASLVLSFLDASGAVLSGSFAEAGAINSGGSAAAGTSQTATTVVLPWADSSAAQKVDLDFEWQPQSTRRYPNTNFTVSAEYGAASATGTAGLHNAGGTNGFNGIRLTLTASANFTSGTFILYGLKVV